MKKTITLGLLSVIFSLFSWTTPVSAAGCEIDYIEFSPFNELTEGSFQEQNYWDKILIDDIKTTVIVHPKNESECAGKKFDLFIMSGYSNKPLTLSGAQFNSAGKFSIPLFPGENSCNPPEGAPNFCTYYAKLSHSWDGQLKSFSSAALGDYQSFPDTDEKQDKGIISYKKQNLGKIWTQNRTSNSDTSGSNPAANNCKVLNAVFTPNGDMGGDYISNNYTNTLKITSTECIGQKIKVEIRDSGTWPDTNADVTVEGTITENLMTINYLPGDKDCDEDEDPDCSFYAYITIPTQIIIYGQGGASAYAYSTEDRQHGEIDYDCHVNISNSEKECEKKWQSKGSIGIVNSNGDIAGVLPQGSYDTNSPCFESALNGGNGGYRDGCYELLAPIPGIGTQYTDGDGNVRDTGFQETADGRQTIDTKNIQLGDYINQIFRIALGILMVIAVIMVIIAGVQYMAVESIFGKTAAKERIVNALTGLLIGLGIFLILSTINPKLLEVNFSPKEVVIEIQQDEQQRQFISSTDIAGIVAPPLPEILEYKPLIGYLYHQQGPYGGPSTLWAAKNGYARVPNKTPFLSNASSVQGNIDAQYGTYMSPKDFVEKFYKVLKAKEAKINTIPTANAAAVQKAATDTGVDANVLKTICMIESYNCTQANVVNKYGYTGLFQFHPQRTWPAWRKSANSVITNAYDNAYAGGRFLKSNLTKYQIDKNKM